jgi:O-antigen/teichoic acid export membrane protein
MGLQPDPGLRGLLYNTSVYTSAAVVQQAAGITFLIMLLSRLTAEDYTRFGLLTSIFALVVPLVSQNIQLAPSRLFFDETSDRGRATILGSSLGGALLLAALGLSAALGLLLAFSLRDPVTGGAVELRLAIAGTILLIIINQFGVTFYRVIGSPHLFLLNAVLQSLGLIQAYLLASTFAPQVSALIYAYLAAQGLSALIVLVTVPLKLRTLRYSRGAVGRAFHFSWPTAVHLLALSAIMTGGRWIGTSSLTLSTLAPYTLVTQLVAVVGALQRSLFDAVVPTVARSFAAADHDHARHVVTRTSLWAGFMGMAVYGVLSVVLEFRPGLLPIPLKPPATLLLLAAFASAFDAWYLRGVQILHYSKRTRTQAVATVTSGVISSTLAFPLVRAYGLDGLLGSLILGVALQAILSNALANRAFVSSPPRTHSEVARADTEHL